MNKKALSESDICDKFIRPAMERAGWNGMDQIYREYPLRAGRMVVRGHKARRDASADGKLVTESLQAKPYAGRYGVVQGILAARLSAGARALRAPIASTHCALTGESHPQARDAEPVRSATPHSARNLMLEGTNAS